ncbi:MAG TPA: cation diffusion facilitator family transporter [Thermoanaerobaculia bacterium]|nr:cation diffusion facilitator family transporter [Thermoanaerobaculia bacterium]
MELAHNHTHAVPDGAHAAPGDRQAWRSRLRGALALTALVLVLEVAGGVISHSLALLADAAHMFADIAALILAYAAMGLADRAPTGRHSFGYYRAEILAAFVNAELLLIMAAWILIEALERVRRPVPVHSGVMLAVASGGLVANFLALRLLARARGESLNMRAAHLEVLTDLIGALAVVVTALLIPRTGWRWLDPAVSIGIAAFIMPRAFSLLKQSAHVLLEGTPGEIDVDALRRRILEVPGVEALHDLHFWTLTSGLHSASVHISASPESARGDVLQAVQRLLRDEAGVDHSTVQVERGAETICQASGRVHA